jgi:hypothetical protein
VKRAASALPVLLGILLCAEAHAEPQISTSLTIGGGVKNLTDSPSRRAAFHLGGWADVLFGRSSASGVGFGPHIHVGTNAFSTLELGAGPTLLIPIGSPVLQLSGSALIRFGEGGPMPGAAATLFLGSRSYNFHGNYGFTLGGFLQGRAGFGRPAGRPDLAPQADLILGLQADFGILALPVLFAVEALRGPRDRR